MSYCRWSTDSFRCDLYCYEDVRGGWTTHVANNRIPEDAPRELPWPNDLPDTADEIGKNAAFQAWVGSHNVLMDYLKNDPPRAPIGGPHDGETFNDPTLETFRERLIMLREAGYRFPDAVLAAVDEEIAERGEV